MASGVYINGKLIQIPGVYGFVDASALAGKFTSTGNMAIVGDFPSLEHDAVYRFTSPQALAGWDPSNLTFARLASLAFGPASDNRIGGASEVSLINVRTNTQAYYDFVDGTGPTESLTLKAKRWGTKGNQVYCKLVSNAADQKLLDITLSCMGLTETYSAVGSGTLAALQLDTAVCTQMAGALSTSSVSISPTVVLPAPANGSLVWTWKRQQTGGDIQAAQVYPAQLLSQMVVTGDLTFSLSQPTPVGCTVVATVIGKNALGVTTTKTATIPAGQLANTQFQVGILADEWSQLTSIQVEVQGNPLGAATSYFLHGTAFDLDLTEFSKWSDVCTHINNYASKGWKCNSVAPKAYNVPADEVDVPLTVNTLAPASASVRADLWAIIQKLSNSALVEAERHDKALRAPSPWNIVAPASVEEQLLGGSENAISTTTDFRDAFSQIETENFQIVVAFSTDVLAAQELDTNCQNAAVLGYERNGYAGVTANTSLANILANWVNVVKSRHVSFAAQEIQVPSPSGALEWVGPEYQAVQEAAMQAGRSVGIPLTNKTPRVFGLRQSWTLQKDDNDVIASGVYAYTQDNQGFKVLRSITSWVQDDNPAFVEVSTNESVNTSIRNLRDNLKIYVGNPANLAVSQLVGIVKGLLDKQVQDGFIRAYRNVVVTQLADKYRIDYDVAPIFALNFFEVTAHVGDF